MFCDLQDHSHHSEDEAEDIPEKPALPVDREKKTERKLLNFELHKTRSQKLDVFLQLNYTIIYSFIIRKTFRMFE